MKKKVEVEVDLCCRELAHMTQDQIKMNRFGI